MSGRVRSIRALPLALGIGAAAALATAPIAASGHPSAPPASPLETVLHDPVAHPSDDIVRGVHVDASGRELAWSLFVPATREPHPALVVLLHGCTQNDDDIAAGTGIDRPAAELGFLVLRPAQDPGRHPQRCWNWYDPAEHRRDGPESSMIRGLVDEVIASYDADPERIFLIGMSAGGSMASLMGATHADRFAAIAVHSGLAFGAAASLPEALAALPGGSATPPDELAARALEAIRQSGAPQGSIPRAIVIQGSDDAVVRPINGQQTAQQWAATRALVRGGATGVPGTATLEEGGRRVDVTRWPDPDGTVGVELHEVEGLAHAWSGGDPAGTYTDPAGPRALERILDFFGLRSTSR